MRAHQDEQKRRNWCRLVLRIGAHCCSVVRGQQREICCRISRLSLCCILVQHAAQALAGIFSPQAPDDESRGGRNYQRSWTPNRMSSPAPKRSEEGGSGTEVAGVTVIV